VTEIIYRALPWEGDWLQELDDLVVRERITRVADLGGGADPSLPLEFIERRGLDYTVFDISSVELENAPSQCRRVVADVTEPGFALGETFDLVLSRWLLEHIESPRSLHRNVLEMLNPGGRAAHFFPTLYSVPFLVNRILPESVSARLLSRTDEAHATGKRKKFPARYRWCRGPTRAQITRFEDAGFVVERYTGYFGHPYYARVKPIFALHARWARSLARHPIPQLTSFASVELVKPH
jgi:2-polyprenyl-3-methyl-5-hydroxy-6-metoxy-1,4-benzoquinol methylase